MITNLFVVMQACRARLPVCIGSGARRARALFGRAIRLNVVLALAMFPQAALAMQGPELGGCDTFVEGSRLSVIGDETANVIEVIGSERGIQVTCDAVIETFIGIEEIMVEGRDGDDNVTIDDSNGLLGGLSINVFSQGRADLTLLVVLPLFPLLETIGITFVGAPGPDVLQIAAGPLAERFYISSGREEANSVEVQVTDIGTETPLANITGSGIEELKVEMGEGDDEANLFPLSGIITQLSGAGGNDSMWDHEYGFRPGKSAQQDFDFNGGIGVDNLQIIGRALADRFDIALGAVANSIEAHLTDIATGTTLTEASAVEVEGVTVKGGDGDDEISVDNIDNLPSGIALNIFGDGDDDTFLNTVSSEGEGPNHLQVSGGPGHDKFSVVGLTTHEHYEVSGEPDQEGPDPQLLMTDLTTGLLIAEFHIQETEEVAVEARGGDDLLDVAWDAALMSGLETIVADLGEGDNTLSAEFLPVLQDPPDPDRVQMAAIELTSGRGNDAVTFTHSAGNWFDLTFTADLGTGDNMFNAVFAPPPDDSLPGPEGMRLLQFDVIAAKGEDFVAVRNQTGGEFFEVLFDADLGAGDDTFEAAGGIPPCVLPGLGFDTARVTRNLLSFVTEFELILIETLE